MQTASDVEQDRSSSAERFYRSHWGKVCKRCEVRGRSDRSSILCESWLIQFLPIWS